MLNAVLRSLLCLLLLDALPAPVVAQEKGVSRKEQIKAQARKEKEREQAAAKQQKEGLKRHQDIQDKATRKRMRRNARRTDRHGTSGHRDPFLQRIFRRKR